MFVFKAITLTKINFTELKKENLLKIGSILAKPFIPFIHDKKNNFRYFCIALDTNNYIFRYD